MRLSENSTRYTIPGKVSGRRRQTYRVIKTPLYQQAGVQRVRRSSYHHIQHELGKKHSDHFLDTPSVFRNRNSQPARFDPMPPSRHRVTRIDKS